MIRVWGAVLAVSALAASSGALAHQGPALPPVFSQAACIVVVDKAETTELHVSYDVDYDDDILSEGDLILSDSPSHQFFAFTGGLSRQIEGFQFFDFTDFGDAVLTPVWITLDDLKRAVDAVPVGAATTSVDSIPDSEVLGANPDFDGRWQRITADADRVPITQEQARAGFDWDLTDVEAGVYTINGYVFSPPFNAWEPRPGVVKVVDGSDSPPAVTLAPLSGFLYTYSGRRIRGCVDAPEGSTLTASFRITEQPEEGWRVFAQDVAVDGENYELCYSPPSRDVSGNARIRIEVTSPEGATITITSAGTFTVLPGEGECLETDEVCCEGSAAAAVADAGGVSADDADPGGPDETETRAEGAAGDADGGCSCRLARPGSPTSWLALFGPVLLLLACRRCSAGRA